VLVIQTIRKTLLSFANDGKILKKQRYSVNNDYLARIVKLMQLDWEQKQSAEVFLVANLETSVITLY
jgi:hypothetical protein